MSIALGALAVVLAGLGGPNPPKAEGAQLTYTFKMVDIRGLDWRAARSQGLRPAASRGGVTVWTAPRDFLRSLPEGTVKEIIAGPRLTSYEQAPAHITTRHGQPFVTQASWRGADLPPRETTEHVREGMAATIRGRRLDQGILTYLVIEDTSVTAVHSLKLPAPAPSQPCHEVAKTAAACCETDCPATGAVAAHDEALTQTSFVPAESTCCAAEAAKTATCSAKATARSQAQKTCEAKCDAKVAAVPAPTAKCDAQVKPTAAERSVQVRIPEIGHAEIAGEWLIPHDEILLVGFGPHTIADHDGKAVVRERLAVITAEEIAAPTAMIEPKAPALPVALPKPTIPAPATASTAALPVPKLPSRNLPQGVNADGTAVSLPPLPEEPASDDPADSSAEPRPSPQTRRPKPQDDAEAPRPAATKDTKATRASFNLPRSLFRPAGLPTIGIPNFQFTMPLKPFELKLPMNQKLQLDLVGRVVADTDSSDDTARE